MAEHDATIMNTTPESIGSKATNHHGDESREKTIGYARTASGSEGLSSQVDRLKAAGCSVVYTDEATSGATLNRAGLKAARKNLRAGDTLKVVSADRIARDHSKLQFFVMDLMRNHIEFQAIEEPDAKKLVALQHKLNVERGRFSLWREIRFRIWALVVGISGQN